jgi:hypothetical protein
MMRSIATRNDADSVWRPEGRSSFLKKRTKRLLRVLSRPSQAAPTPEFAKVFCFFSSEKKTFLPATFLAFLLLSACSSPDPTLYALQSLPGTAVAAPTRVIEVRRPGLAGYLDRPSIITATPWLPNRSQPRRTLG